MKQNLHPDEALALVLGSGKILGSESLPLGDALGRVLAESLPARVDSPPFDKSAMDGYALAGPDDSNGHVVVATLAAGSVIKAPLVSGQAVRIMTGAPIPQGATRVLRFEWAELRSDRVFPTRTEPSDNIIRQGENMRAGDPLMTPRRLAPQDIGLLASSGYARIPVRCRPRVGVVSTGDEIQPAGSPLAPGKIWDSNGPQLVAQAVATGALATFYGIAEDRPEILQKVLSRAIAENDLILVSGGVSMGDFDHVPAALAACGVRGIFHQLQMRPGKPTWFGVKDDGQGPGRPSYALGLPGNPVSTFVNFLVFAQPLLEALSGIPEAGVTRLIPARLLAPIRRKNAAVVEFRPVILERDQVRPVEYHGSSMLNGLAGANALVRMEIGCAELAEGERVDVRPIRTHY